MACAEWPTDGTAHLGRDAWELAKERLTSPNWNLAEAGVSAKFGT